MQMSVLDLSVDLEEKEVYETQAKMKARVSHPVKKLFLENSITATRMKRSWHISVWQTKSPGNFICLIDT